MAILKAQSYPTTLGKPPTTRSAFLNDCNVNRIDWTDGMKSLAKGVVTPGYGVKTTMPSNSAYGDGKVETSVWQDHIDFGFKLELFPAGAAGQSNVELRPYGNGARWMPAAIFNGCGFELHQSADYGSSLYVTQYALVFVSATSETYRFVGNTLNDGHNGAPFKGYRYADFSSQTYIDEIRSFGSSWLFQGIILNIKNGEGISFERSSVKLWNLKMYHKCVGSTSTDHRIFAPKLKSFAYRNEPYHSVNFS